MTGAVITMATVRAQEQELRRCRNRRRRRPKIRDSRIERNCCAYCAMPAEGWDHVDPLAKGGKNTPDNRVPACTQCNCDKADMSLVVFLALSI